MTEFQAAPVETIWRIPIRLAEVRERRVLIADDDIRGAHALAIALDEAGFATRTTHTGLDAVTAAKQWKPGAILLDLSMPLGDGWEAAAAIRSYDPEIFLVAHTGFTSRAEWIRSEEIGIDAYFVKPCNLSRLFELLGERFPT
jgi:DNA-binding response OmpR family regulator